MTHHPAQWSPSNVYVIAGFSDANGDPIEAGLDPFFDDQEYSTHIELGWVSSFDRRYFDNIHLTAWHVDKSEKAQAPDVQLIINPASNPDQDLKAVFGLRARLTFLWSSCQTWGAANTNCIR